MTSIARRVTWQNLEREVFDLLVIGGGITGAGIARDAALRGLKVALVEKNDFAAGTSSKSSKLIHGGLRYLQQAELSLVFEAVSERTRLLKLAPHLVRPQRFLVPAYRGKFPGRMALNAGLLMYDALSRFSAPGRHRTYRKKALLAKEPGLRDERLTGGVTYYDSITDDARLTIENILDAKRHGAQILSYARVTGFIEGKTEGNESLISGVTVQGVIDPERSAKSAPKSPSTPPGRGLTWCCDCCSATSLRRCCVRPRARILVLDAARLPVHARGGHDDAPGRARDVRDPLDRSRVSPPPAAPSWAPPIPTITAIPIGWPPMPLTWSTCSRRPTSTFRPPSCSQPMSLRPGPVCVRW
jgi:hypothetical protein